ncbi:hypothetical protein SUGI_0412290 [Cryptomeria japonica]|nr:hypothetical protein SUGI_0412290 [Cryptomeria japonica]
MRQPDATRDSNMLWRATGNRELSQQVERGAKINDSGFCLSFWFGFVDQGFDSRLVFSGCTTCALRGFRFLVDKKSCAEVLSI